MAKLTLHVPEDLVEAAKTEAAARRVSVSKLVTDFFRNLSSRGHGDSTMNPDTLSPRTKRLAGCVRDADLEDYVDYLEEKHS